MNERIDDANSWSGAATVGRHGARLTALVLGLFALAWQAPVSAHADPSARRLGAFAGAMKYCAEHYDEQERRYRRARLRVFEEVDGMSRDERRRAVVARNHAYERGTFLGKRLDRRECRVLLRMSEWQRFELD